MGNQIQQPGINDPLTIVVTVVIFLVVLIAIFIISKLKLPINKFKQISPSQTKSMIISKSVILIDLRKSNEYQEAHIDGALSMDNETLTNFINQTNKSSTIVCYCYKGISSKGACQKFFKSGFRNVYNLKGGFEAWRKAYM